MQKEESTKVEDDDEEAKDEIQTILKEEDIQLLPEDVSLSLTIRLMSTKLTS